MSSSVQSVAFGRRLREVRHDYGRSLGRTTFGPAEFARLLGVNPRLYCDSESGRVAPRLELLAAAHELTSISLDWLVVGEGQGTFKPRSGRAESYTYAPGNM